MSVGNVINLNLNGAFEVMNPGTGIVARGYVPADTGLQQLDAFLSGLRMVLEGSEKSLCHDLARALHEVRELTTSHGNLLSLVVQSNLDPKSKSLTYSFTLKVSPDEE